MFLNDKNICLLSLGRIAEKIIELVSQEGESRFSFLEDLFSSSNNFPILAELAEFGREAEENLFLNTRYSVICMGDIGESIAYILLNEKNIPHEKDQIDRIKMLVNRSVIPKDAATILHELRMARNQAIHSRFNLESNAKELLEKSLMICEEIFRYIISSNDFVKAKITDINETEKNISVSMGKISGIVEEAEIPPEEFENLKIGDKRIFRVINGDDEIIKLSLKDINTDAWKILERRYDKYEVGQDVNVIIRNITKSMGAVVELKDGLTAKIPDSELGRKIFNRNKGLKYEVKARVKWFDPKHYPYMILSVKDIEDEQRKEREAVQPDEVETEEYVTGYEAMPDSYFIDFCKNENAKKISEELEKGANPNAKNHVGTTALMTAATYNKDHEVLEALLKAGAKVNARNSKGNTALIFATMYNTHKSVKVLLEAGADVNIIGHERHKAIYYAEKNKKLRKRKTLLKLLKGQKIPDKISPSNAPLNKKIIALCRRGTLDEIIAALDNGADVNFINNNSNTPLIIASQFGDANMVKLLIERGANINYQNSLGNTALHVAAEYGTSDTIEALLNAGADIDLKNNKDLLPYDLVTKRKALKNSELLEKMMKPKMNTDYQKNFIKICRAGTEQEISEAINSGVNVNVKNKSLSTALMFAARYNTAEAVEILINAGANLNSQDIYGNTALIYAASFNTDDVVKVLIDGGSDIEIKNIAGYKALDYAKQNYRLEDSEVMKSL